MDSVTLDLLIALSVVQVLLTAGSVFFAYKISRLLGSFLGWSLVVVGIGLYTLKSASSLLLLPFLSGPEIDSLLGQIGAGTLYVSALINVGGPLVLLMGMYFLSKTFERQLKKPERKALKEPLLVKSRAGR